MKSHYTGTATDQVLCGLRQRPLRRRPVRLRSEVLAAGGFLAPTVLLLALLAVYPLFYSIYLSMTTTQVGVPGRFVGTYVIPNMFARAAQASSNSDAIAFAVKALSDIGYSK